jgi:hypothetical protein
MVEGRLEAVKDARQVRGGGREEDGRRLAAPSHPAHQNSVLALT